MTKDKDQIVGMYEVLDALEAVIYSADPIKRKDLAEIMDEYSEDFPDDFHWAVGAQSPALLSNLVMAIDIACRANEPPKSRTITFRWQDTKGNA
jgi:hypothetical protein